MLIDVHVHLLGVREENGCRVGKRFQSDLMFKLVARAFGLGGVAREDLDDAYRDKLATYARESSLDGIGVLAFDGVYDARGELDTARTQVMVGNDYCLKVCRDEDKLLPICSVNPQRKDAIEELERVADLGAVALKALPNSQGFDPLQDAYRPFWRRVAQLGLPIISHTSFEHTIPPIDQRFGHPVRLLGPLEEGVTVIAAHCAGSGVGHPFVEHHHIWREMLDDHPNLYGDVSAFCSVSRFPYLTKVLEHPKALGRVVFGSDYPIPVQPSVFVRHLGLAKVRELGKIENPLERNLETMRAMGVPESVMRRGAELLKL